MDSQRQPAGPLRQEGTAASDARDDLRATETSIIDDAERLAAIEREKQSHDPADPAVPVLSERAHELSKTLRVKAAAESSLVQEIQANR